MITSSELIAKIKSYHEDLDEKLIQKAYIFSKNSHGNQTRFSGEPYFSHPLAVAEILADLKMDQWSIVTALLHDVVEDTEVVLQDVEKNFGRKIAKLVDGVTKLNKIENISKKEEVAQNFRKLTMAMSQDIRVLIVKLADRLHNMRTILYMPSKEKRIKIAKESLDIYAVLAGRIGLNKIKDELQDLSFEIIDAETRNFIIARLSELREEKKDFIAQIIGILSEKLTKENVEFTIAGRQKTPFSIWNKMKKDNVGFHNLYDIMAFRIIVNDVASCYQALGVVNSSYNMIPSSFNDYISTPKENGYKSLHSTILGPFNKKIEIQIRDKEMDRVAEYGLAAHWNYKENKNESDEKEIEKFNWIKNLLTSFENVEYASEVLDENKIDLHKDLVFCFTPAGDIFKLPQGSTAVDFAYEIHSEIGNICVGAKINSAISPLKTRLENGDQVEILTSKNAKPSINWLQFVVTSKARNAIKNFLRNEKYDEFKKLGKAIIKKYYISKNVEIDEDIFLKYLKDLQVKNLDEFYVKIAQGLIARSKVLNLTNPEFKEENKVLKNSQTRNKIQNSDSPIEGLVKGMAIHYAGCCNPIPYDIIIAVVNTGIGITIHNQNCKTFKNLALNPSRIIDISWSRNSKIISKYSCRIKLVIENKSGKLAEISNIIAKKKVNIINIKTINRNNDFFEILIDLEVSDSEHLDEILSDLRISNKILEAKRV